MTEPYSVTLAGDGGTFAAAPGERLLSAARRAGRWLPYECGWGSCGTCKATLVSGTTELLAPDSPGVSERDARRNKILLCQSAATSDVVVKPLRVADDPLPERDTRDLMGEVTAVERLADGIARFHLAVTDRDGASVTAAYRPGQYAILGLGDGLRRCYSMAGLPGRDRVEFIAKHYPGRPGSTALFDLTVGQQVPLELPYGDMWLRPGERPLLLIAGGTGISAILALVAELAGTADPREIHVVYGANAEPDLVCWDEIRALAAALPLARVTGSLLSPEPGWDGATGLVTDALAGLATDTALDLTTCDVYLAGPPPMVSAVQTVLDERAHQRDRRFVDSFG